MLRSVEGHDKAMLEAGIFNVLTFMLVLCYVWCIVVHPGTIPDRDIDPSWEYVPQDGKAAANEAQLLEWKRSGDRRYCKWCAKYKPDRCHHCRVCRLCILKMDHHCPWIYNCVGFRNHKYFFLLLFYSALACHFITWTMLETVLKSVDQATPFSTMFLLLFGEILAAFVGILVTGFFAFHVWLMLSAMTTIEFCEKATGKRARSRSPYSRGVGGNIRAVLGEYPLLWFLPTAPPTGSGLYFVDGPVLARDLEGDRGVSRRRSQEPRGQNPTRRDLRRESRRDPCCDAFEAPASPAAPIREVERERSTPGGYGAMANEVPIPMKTKQQRSSRQNRSNACC
mmetsp:Transcript_26541/g.61391  ORF Transcript_26541/g.61391 Transcript_26541/m.61391 type:complete len:339 (+) Transcript_26541:2-1018(+)